MNLVVIICLWTGCYLSQSMAELSPSERKEFLDWHNYLRRSVVPSATDMQELIYNEKIEADVYDHLDQCKFEHRRLDGYGENGRLSTDNNITNTVMSWFQERVYFDMTSQDESRCSKGNSKQLYLDEVQCGHYKMMVRATLKSIGCGYKFCKAAQGNGVDYADSFITFCFYNAGQMDQPYTAGTTCSECGMSYQFCHNDMCVPKSKYEKSLLTCKLKCKHCAKYFDPKNSCLCDCPDGTDGNSCNGIPDKRDDTCSPCRTLGQSCNGGVENVNAGTCSCVCNNDYQGEYCEVRKDQFASSYEWIINGAAWRYNMAIPVNVLEFKNLFPIFRTVIAKNVIDFCLRNAAAEVDCADINKFALNEKDVFLIPGYPSMFLNGSIVIRIFMNFSAIIDGSKHEKFVSPSIVSRVINIQSPRMTELLDRVKLMNPSSNGQINQNYLFKRSPKFQSLNNVNHGIMETAGES